MPRIFFVILSLGAIHAATFSTIYQFGDSIEPQAHPVGQMVLNSQGVIYGVTSNTFFSLTPPTTPDGLSTTSVLYEFGVNGGDGMDPLGVVSGPDGALYGATSVGGTYN